MMILYNAAGPAVLAVNVPSPSSLLSSWGGARPFAIEFAETGRSGQGPWAPDRTPPSAPSLASGSPPGRTGPLTPARA
jgi:hypothetical protein